MPAETVALQFLANEQDTVSALLIAPAGAYAGFVFAHGAGAGMQHPFMQSLAHELGQRGVATLRYQFPYMQNELKRPDSPAIAQTAVRAAVAEASRRLPGVPLFAGGKSYGGRMSSQAQSADPLPNVIGVVFVGFPLHPAGNPSLKRADHLTRVGVPMLFLQGTRDALGDLGLLRVVVGRLGNRATLATFEDADHSFHVRKASGSTDDGVLRAIADTAANWMSAIAAQRR